VIYFAYQSQADIMLAVRTLAAQALSAMNGTLNGSLSSFAAQPLRNLDASYEMLSRAGLSHARPPFGTLLHFKKDVDTAQPRVMVVAPLSGHFATLLRETVRTLLPEHDVYITDWHNARDVPAADGRFGFDDYVEHIIEFLGALGPGAHVVAVCQPCVAALVAAAVMAKNGIRRSRRASR
jgi:polyhydroxyalkanoate depolymerase